MLRNLVLATLSIVAVLATLEIVVRVTGLGVHDLVHESEKYARLLVDDEVGGYSRHRPGESTMLQGVSVQFNSLGMRDPEPRLPKPAGAFRLLILGDSVTFGPAVPAEEIYPARLRRLLAPEGVDVVTAAVAGWNTVMEDRFLETNVARLDPDLVLVLYVVNDNELVDPFSRARRPPTGWASRAYRALLLHSELFEWGAFLYQAKIAGPDPEDTRRFLAWVALQKSAGTPFSTEDRGWIASRAALERMTGLTRSRGADLVVFLQNQENGPLEHKALARLHEFGDLNDVRVFDTWDFFAGYPPLRLMNDGLRDPHPNAQGHELLANGIARTLRAAGLFGRRSPAPTTAPDSQRARAPAR